MNRSLQIPRVLIAAALVLTACGAASASTAPINDTPINDTPINDTPINVTPTNDTPTTDPRITSSAATSVELPPLAITGADGSITVVRGGAVAGVYPDARLAVDGHTLVSATPSSNGTKVEWVDISTGRSAGSAMLDGTFELSALDEPGESAVVVSPAAAVTGSDIAGARTSTELAIIRKPVDPAQPAAVVYRTTVSGNVLPEMLGPSYPDVPGSVFMLEYLPADHPAAYRVRVLDTSSGRLAVPLDLREKIQAADESMAGISRAQVMVPSRKLLLTVYRGRNPDGSVYAFVHALRYDGIQDGPWPGTYCLDIPDSLQLQASPASVAVSADQETMFIANGSGTIGSLRVRDLDDHTHAPALHSFGQVKDMTDHAPAIAASDSAVWVAYGKAVTELHPSDLVQRQRFMLPDDVLALTSSPAGLVAVGASAITLLDQHGAVLGRWPVAVDQPRRVALVP